MKTIQIKRGNIATEIEFNMKIRFEFTRSTFYENYYKNYSKH